MTVARDLGLGPIDQVAYVVESLDRSLPRYEAMFGPFHTLVFEMKDCAIGDRRGDCKLRIGLNTSSPVEIELIEVIEGETPHSDHLKQHGEGLHHVGYRVNDCAAALAAMVAAGATAIDKEPRPGSRGTTVAFVHPKGSFGTLIELVQE